MKGVRRLVLLGALAACAARAGTFEPVAVHPDASAQPTGTGRTLRTLAPWRGQLYAGYGDYDANTGPITIRPFDPATLTFSAAGFPSATEAVYLYRDIAGDLHAPHVDPLAGESSVGFARALAFAPDRWDDRFVVTAVHVYDAFTFDGTDRWIIGSRGANAAAWRAPDGAGWVDVPEISVAPTAPASFARFYFALRHEGLLFLQDSTSSVSKVFDGTTWTDGPDLLPGGGYGWHAESLAGLSVYQATHAGFGASALHVFDGASARALPIRAYDFTLADGNVWALTATWVPQPGTSAGGYWVMDRVHQTADLCTWRAVTGLAPPELRSIAVLDGTVWAGATEAALLRWSDAVAPLPAGPPPEVQALRLTKSGADVAMVWQPASSIGDCVEHVVVASTAWPQDDLASWAEAGRTRTATWSHAGALTDGVALRSYLVFGASPAGDGAWGAFGR